MVICFIENLSLKPGMTNCWKHDYVSSNLLQQTSTNTIKVMTMKAINDNDAHHYDH